MPGWYSLTHRPHRHHHSWWLNFLYCSVHWLSCVINLITSMDDDDTYKHSLPYDFVRDDYYYCNLRVRSLCLRKALCELLWCENATSKPYTHTHKPLELWKQQTALITYVHCLLLKQASVYSVYLQGPFVSVPNRMRTSFSYLSIAIWPAVLALRHFFSFWSIVLNAQSVSVCCWSLSDNNDTCCISRSYLHLKC